MFTTIAGVLGRVSAGLATLLVAAAASSAETAAQPGDTKGAGSAPKVGSVAAVATPVKEVRLKVRIIHAGRRGNSMDTRIRDIEKLLKPVFKFTSYRLVKEEKLALAFEKETRVPLPFQRGPKVSVTQLGRADRKIRLRLRVGQGDSIVLKIENGGTFLHGLTLKNGQSFILAFSAKAD